MSVAQALEGDQDRGQGQETDRGNAPFPLRRTMSVAQALEGDRGRGQETDTAIVREIPTVERETFGNVLERGDEIGRKCV